MYTVSVVYSVYPSQNDKVRDCPNSEQFLLFPQCFQKACSPEASKGVAVWEWVN